MDPSIPFYLKRQTFFLKITTKKKWIFQAKGLFVLGRRHLFSNGSFKFQMFSLREGEINCKIEMCNFYKFTSHILKKLVGKLIWVLMDI